MIRIPPEAVRMQHGHGGTMSVNAMCPHCRRPASFTPQSWAMHPGLSREAKAACPSCHEEVRLFHLNPPNPHRNIPGEQQSPPEVWMHPAPPPLKPDAEFLPSEFFEATQLYRVHPVPLPPGGDSFNDLSSYAPLNLHCEHCASDQTFRACWAERDRWRAERRSVTPGAGLAGDVVAVTFACMMCQRFQHKFLFGVDEGKGGVFKIGQHPPMAVQPSKLLERGLGTHADDYRKGMICESHGFGVGAFAYYRQIVENVIAALLKDLERYFSDDAGKEKYHEAISGLKASQNATEKIQVIKELLPRQLMIEGQNPLGLLYGALSEGLHAGTDERCLELAEVVRTVLVTLVEKVEADKQSERNFKAALPQLRQKLDKQIEKKSK